MLAVQSLPTITNRFKSYQTATDLTYFLDDVVSGTKTQVTLEIKKTGETFTLEIISKQPLRNQELRYAIAQATGRTHWDFKIQNLAAFDYEF
jgi:hypothetical protein